MGEEVKCRAGSKELGSESELGLSQCIVSDVPFRIHSINLHRSFQILWSFTLLIPQESEGQTWVFRIDPAEYFLASVYQYDTGFGHPIHSGQ